MSRTFVVAGLLVDAWRDQSRQTEPSEMNQPGSAIPITRFNDTSDDVPSTPLVASLIELSAMKWEPR